MTARFYDLSGNSCWRTPEHYIAAARRAMGGIIDLDPASDEDANRIVRAVTYFSPQNGQDGLNLSWCGNVWLNPPYSDFRGQAGQWIAKLRSEYMSRNVTQAIALINLGTAYQTAVQAAMDVAAAVCIPNERIQFDPPPGYAGKVTRPTQANMLIYFGRYAELFAREFRQFGTIFDVARPG